MDLTADINSEVLSLHVMSGSCGWATAGPDTEEVTVLVGW